MEFGEGVELDLLCPLPIPRVTYLGAATNARGRPLANILEMLGSERYYLVVAELPQVQCCDNEVEWTVNSDGEVTIEGQISPAALSSNMPIGRKSKRVQLCPTEPWSMSFYFPGPVEWRTASVLYTSSTVMEITVDKTRPVARLAPGVAGPSSFSLPNWPASEPPAVVANPRAISTPNGPSFTGAGFAAAMDAGPSLVDFSLPTWPNPIAASYSAGVGPSGVNNTPVWPGPGPTSAGFATNMAGPGPSGVNLPTWPGPPSVDFTADVTSPSGVGLPTRTGPTFAGFATDVAGLWPDFSAMDVAGLPSGSGFTTGIAGQEGVVSSPTRSEEDEMISGFFL